MRNPIDRLYDLSLIMDLIASGTSDDATAAILKMIKKETWELAMIVDEEFQERAEA